MRPLHLLPLLFSVSAFAQSTPPPAQFSGWTRQVLTEDFWSEGASVADVNKDGKPDVLCGPYWYAGPDFTKRSHVYADSALFTGKKPDGSELKLPGFGGFKSNVNNYSDNFLTAVCDVNGDGWTDYLTIGYPGKETYWYENPKNAEGFWKRRTALELTDNESPMLGDINGDKQPDLLCMSKGTIGYATFDPAKPDELWTWHAITPKGKFQRYTHGIGHGDVNGDGLTDIVELNGWWEQPKSLAGDPEWKFHAHKFGVQGGSQMYVYDVNADGRNDIITSLSAHEYGIAWFEQTAEGWARHLIVGTPKEPGETGILFSQPHALAMADMNGDGILDVISGKRLWGHGPNGDPEPNAPSVVWWFELQREGGKATYKAHFVDGNSGVGCQFSVADLNGDGKPDIITGNKRGAFVLMRK